MKVYQTITDLVGRTPLLEVTKIEAEEQTGAKIFAKLELFNPAGSVKDRVAVAMINDAEKRGVLKARQRDHRADQRQHRYRPCSQ